MSAMFQKAFVALITWGAKYRTTNSLVENSVANKGNPPAIRRPAGYIHGSLSAVEVSNYFYFSPTNWHHPQINPLVKRMFIGRNLFGECNEYQPFVIRRNMRKPVVQIIERKLGLVFAVRFHAPNLHSSCPGRTEIDVFSIGWVFRTIIQTPGIR